MSRPAQPAALRGRATWKALMPMVVALIALTLTFAIAVAAHRQAPGSLHASNAQVASTVVSLGDATDARTSRSSWSIAAPTDVASVTVSASLSTESSMFLETSRSSWS
jgi:hypothetical protein